MSRQPDLRSLPSIDALLSTVDAQELMVQVARSLLTATLRAVLDDHRRALQAGERAGVPGSGEIVAEARRRIDALARPALTPVVNATGVLVHTNLGRSILPEPVIEAIAAAARAPVALEYDLATGRRGERDRLIEDDLAALTGAPAATVVNNNAAAVLLVLHALAEGREVVVSRGELVEIGGSFRLPDILAKSGARLHEVGTTNRTHLGDYERAINPETALLMKVHTSNYKVVGFTRAVAINDLVALGRARDLPVVEDLGSGALVDLAGLVEEAMPGQGLGAEPVVGARLAAGVDVLTFSGDKLLGGPQAGVIVGRADLIDRIRANPLRRALRPGKLALAGLAATLRLYRTAPDLPSVFPLLRAVTRSLDSIEETTYEAAERLREVLGPDHRIALVESECEIGSGALPEAVLPSRAIAITHVTDGPDSVARRFREADPPIIGRIHEGAFLLDMRAITDPAAVVPRRLD